MIARSQKKNLFTQHTKPTKMTKRTKTITQAITRKQKILKYQARYREVNRYEKKYLKELEEKYFELSIELEKKKRELNYVGKYIKPSTTT